MRNMKKWAVLLLTMAVGVSSLAGCGSQKTSTDKSESAQSTQTVQVNEETAQTEQTTEEAEEEDPFLTGEKPVLNILFYNQTYDMNADAAKAIMEEITGYEVVYHNLPAENASEKLMLEIASGAEYDMIYRCKVKDYRELVSQNAAMDITELLNKYGNEVLQNVGELDWSMVTDENGTITGMLTPAPSSLLIPYTVTSPAVLLSEAMFWKSWAKKFPRQLMNFMMF